MPPRFRRLYPDSAISVEAERRAAVRALLTGIFSAQAMLLAFSLKLRAGAALKAQDAGPAAAGGAASSAPYRQPQQPEFFCAPGAAVLASLGGRASSVPGAGGLALRRLARDGLGWVPTAGNVCAALAFVGCLRVNGHVTDGEPEAVLLLAPLLLLLSQDPLLLRGLGEQQRYVPPVAAITAYLTVSAVSEAASWGARLGDIGFVALNAGLLLLTLPMHAVFLHHMWHQKPRPLAALCALAPLCLVALFATQLEEVRYLGAIGLVMALLLFFDVRQLRQRGMKMI